MYKYRKRASSVLFSAVLVLGIILFTVFGATFAYFQISNVVESQYTLGEVDACWHNGVKEISGNTVNLAPEGSKVVRGDNNGIDISIKAESSGSSGNVLYLRTGSESAAQYVRIKFDTYIIDATTLVETKIDLVKYLSFRMMNESKNVDWVLGDGNSSPWITGSDGWYYYREVIGDEASANLSVCNNIFMSSDFPADYLGQKLKIEFSFETIQAANNAVNVWGEAAKSALGLS